MQTAAVLRQKTLHRRCHMPGPYRCTDDDEVKGVEWWGSEFDVRLYPDQGFDCTIVSRSSVPCAVSPREFRQYSSRSSRQVPPQLFWCVRCLNSKQSARFSLEQSTFSWMTRSREGIRAAREEWCVDERQIHFVAMRFSQSIFWNAEVSLIFINSRHRPRNIMKTCSSIGVKPIGEHKR
jgi:hypothetical protein